MGLSDAPLSSGECVRLFWGLFGASHSADYSVGEVAFAGSSGFASGLAFAGFSGEVGGCLGCCRAWVTEAMCSTLLTRRLPLKSSRCLSGSPLPWSEDEATAPVPHQRSNSGLAVEPGRVADVAQQSGC